VRLVFKLKLKYNLAYRINTVKLKSNANMLKVNMMVQRLVSLLLVLVSLTGCKESSRDEVEMVRIPMISGYTKVGNPIYQDFYMDVTEVTVGQFKKFLKSSGYEPSKPIDGAEVYETSLTDDHPMIYVSWFDAVAYCEWVGKRLPTEKEWEYAARGNLAGKLYPLGDDVNYDDANYLSVGGKDKWNKQAAPVGSFAANGFGLLDVAGNVWEWCLDSYDNRFYHKSPRISPISACWSIEEVMKDYVSVTSKRVLRGGS